MTDFNQNTDKHYRKLKSLINEINPTLGKMMPQVIDTPMARVLGTGIIRATVSLASAKLPDDYEKQFTPKSKNIDQCYYAEPRVGSSYDLKKCKNLLKNILNIQSDLCAATINEHLVKTSELNKEPTELTKLLNQTIRLNHYYFELAIFNPSFKPNSVSFIDVSVRETINVIIPKIIILDQFDTLLAKTQNKLTRLRKKDEEEGLESDITDAAKQMVLAASKARSLFIQSATVEEGLKQIESTINEAYEEHKEILATHRGILKNEAIQTVWNLFRGLLGIAAAIITSPGLICARQQTQAFVYGFFESPKTESQTVFDQFKKSTEISSLNTVVSKP